MSTLLFQPYLVAISMANVDQAVYLYRVNLSFGSFKQMDFPEHALQIVFVEQHGFQLELIEKQSSFSIKERLPDLEDDVFVRWG